VFRLVGAGGAAIQKHPEDTPQLAFTPGRREGYEQHLRARRRGRRRHSHGLAQR
jgi:hypothetical protein